MKPTTSRADAQKRVYRTHGGDEPVAVHRAHDRDPHRRLARAENARAPVDSTKLYPLIPRCPVHRGTTQGVNRGPAHAGDHSPRRHLAHSRWTGRERRSRTARARTGRERERTPITRTGRARWRALLGRDSHGAPEHVQKKAAYH